MKEIPVSGWRYKALVDEEDFKRVVELGRWKLITTRGKSSVRRVDYKNGGQIPIVLHRFVLGLTSGTKRPQVYFKDNNPLNCQKNNLIIEVLGSLAGVGTIACRICKLSLPESYFYLRENGRYRNECKQCSCNCRRPTAEATRRSNLRRKYNLTPEDWSCIFEKQNRQCAICKSPEPTAKGWTVDHSHQTKEVRGILCSRCNTMIGQAQENIKTLQNAIQYLQKF